MDIQAFGIALVPITMGITEVFKGVGLSGKYAPIVSLVTGIVLGVATTPENYGQGMLTGIAIGLSASGLYSGAKALTRKDD